MTNKTPSPDAPPSGADAPVANADVTIPPASRSFTRVVHTLRIWWRDAVTRTVDQAAVIANRREESDFTARYIFMLMMSAGIAILGLLLSSPAVVIGAMLLSPLMGPIIGLGFSLAVGDFNWMRQAARTLAIGTILSVLLCAFIVMLSPLQTVTSEIAARTRPNLFDLGVALFSALAGAYAMIRGREGTVVGVAIATALMPPLAVVGFGLATLNLTVFTGALLLYITNLMTIALTAAVMARLYGFRTTLSGRQTQLQTALIAVVFIALAIPLGLALRQIAWEAQAARVIKGEVMEKFENTARLSEITINFDSSPIAVEATILTPMVLPDAERATGRAIQQRLEVPVNMHITQYQVGTGSKAAEEAQLAAVRDREAADRRRVEQLAARLALVAGVDQKELLIDRERRRAIVTARELEGATLGAYRELETRIAATEPNWTVELRPPAKPLPSIGFEEGEPNTAGQVSLDLAIWAARRISAPLVLYGTPENREWLAARLREAGIKVVMGNGGAATGTVSLRWGAPDS